jgi:outer membrane lipoprotein-sorting protein
MFSVAMISCKSTRKAIKSPLKEYGADYLFTKLKESELKFDWFSAKFSLDLEIDKKKTSVTGQVRMKKDSIIWVTLSPALGIEMARLLITADSVKFVNRINKTYFSGDYATVNKLLEANIDYDVFQTLLLGNDLTYYEDGKFRASYDSKEYHLVTAGRQKLKKYVKTTEDEERIYIQNIYLDPETFKITQMKIKEVKKENKKLDATYNDFKLISGQLFPHHILFNLLADKPIQVDLEYNRIQIDEPQEFPFKISDKYARIQ